MNSGWKIYIKDRENLRTLLNLILANRETELTIRKTDVLTLVLKESEREEEILQYAKEELGNKVERSDTSQDWDENVFLVNRPKFNLYSVYPFLVETAFFLVKGDSIHLRIERYKTLNPLKRRRLDTKGRKVLYRVKIYTPILVRDYSSREGTQCLTFEKGNPLVLSSLEIASLINGGENNGLLAL